MVNMKKFEVGKEYRCPGLYGGEYIIKVVDRTETTISFIFDKRTSDDRSVQTVAIKVQNCKVYNHELEEIGCIDTETAVAWEYHPQYAKPDEYDYGYYFAFDIDKLYTKDELEAETEERGEDVEVIVTAKNGETRVYKTYAEYKKDFRFFWSGGRADKSEDGTEEHFEKNIQALRLANKDGAQMESHRNGLTTIFTLKQWRSEVESRTCDSDK